LAIYKYNTQKKAKNNKYNQNNNIVELHDYAKQNSSQKATKKQQKKLL
jgi:hypothetical protein